MAIPVAVVVVLATVRREGDRAYISAVLGGAWIPVVAGTLRARWAVAAASCVEAVLTLAWMLFVLVIAARPCALSGRGILTATPQCPVQATHVVSAVVGSVSSIALIVGIVGGLRYASGGEEQAHRLFRNALLVGAVLILVWMASDLILPRNHPSD